MLDFERGFKEINGIVLTLNNDYTLGRRLHIKNKHDVFFLNKN